MNKVIMLGRLTKDPEIRYTQSAEPLAVARYGIAVRKQQRRVEGEPDADFFNCVAFGRAAEFAEKYFKKGQMVAVTGRLQNRSWDDQQGQKHYMTEIIIEEQHFAESKGASSSDSGYSQPSASSAPKAASPGKPGGAQNDGFFEITEGLNDEDLPF